MNFFLLRLLKSIDKLSKKEIVFTITSHNPLYGKEDVSRKLKRNINKMNEKKRKEAQFTQIH